jgi:L,D-peptidoglycan transpeptidase YkuD (ErfK/YbiS/YcfS/YnhG family)
VTLLIVRAPATATRGTLTLGSAAYPCTLGRGGIVGDKREGDGGTPVGRFPLRRLFHRPDQEPAPETGLPATAITADMGWCDDPADPDNYNRLVRLPFAAGHERLWRDDRLYDLVVEIGYNDAPPVPGRGSAIFLHLARPDRGPTEGCVALDREALTTVLAALDPGSAIDIALGS